MYRRQRSGFDRVPFAGVCEVAQGGAHQRALLCNLSILGAYLHTESPPARNSEIELRFELPDGGPPVVAAATVTWVNDASLDGSSEMPCGFGARFLAAAPEDVRRIANLVANFVSDPHAQYQVGVGLPPSGKARIPFVAPCIFTGETKEFRGTLCNLSTLGAFVALDRLPRQGEKGTVRFGVPGIAGDFKVDASVAWLNPEYPRRMRALPPGCGLAFENLSPIDEAILTTVVESYLGAVAAELAPAGATGVETNG
jgi:hypothetical protein